MKVAFNGQCDFVRTSANLVPLQSIHSFTDKYSLTPPSSPPLARYVLVVTGEFSYPPTLQNPLRIFYYIIEASAKKFTYNATSIFNLRACCSTTSHLLTH
ncbi:hypothetical protein P3S67_025467 [Capsicum chacoense]